MEARAKTEEDNDCSSGICNNGMDGLLDYCDSENSSPDMGSLQYIRYFEGKQQGGKFQISCR